MCVIIICEERKLSKTIFENAIRTNPDGAGIAWRERGDVHMAKGTSKSQIQHIWDLSQNVDLPYIFHARITTQGGSNDRNCHPFELENGGMLFHNGNWKESEWTDLLLRICISKRIDLPNITLWSDSQAIAWCVNHLGYNFIHLLSSQKIAIIDETEILTNNNFLQYEGFRCSNLNFVTSYKQVYPASSYYKNYYDDETEIWDPITRTYRTR